MRRLLVLALSIVTAQPVAAQSSIFGIRGLGYPGRGISPRAWAMGGSTGLLDGESGQNPASIGGLTTMAASFLVAPQFRSTETPAGTASPRETQFPFFLLAGPIRTSPVALGISYSNYTSRSFRGLSTGTVDIRGTPVDFTDKLDSRGGMNDLRLAGAYRFGTRITLGAGLHVLTGVNRMSQSRTFADTSYLGSTQTTELSFAGWGVSLGGTYRAGHDFAVGVLLRSDTKATVDQDSLQAYEVDLPYTVGVGTQLRLSRGVLASAQVTYRTWSAANSDLLRQGGNGSDNTIEVGMGAEWTPDPRRPNRRPVRLGVRYAQLPFLVAGTQPTEFGVALGTGFRFSAQRGQVDLALERTWRKAGSAYSERSWVLILGVTVRPALIQ